MNVLSRRLDPIQIRYTCFGFLIRPLCLRIANRTLACLPCSGFSIFYSMFKMETLYKTALEIRKEQRIDLILSDSIMPRINGQQLFDRIPKAYPKIPFVSMTGFSTHKGFFRNIPVLGKPISRQMLIEVFEHLLPDSNTSIYG
ncbi:MAG: response regulator [Myxococcota bacterium]|nr:response regulator [Myxococcota bacterium]